MTTIKTLGARVEQEHLQHLRERQRIQSQTASFAPQAGELTSGGLLPTNGEIDFASLVASAHGGASNATTPAAATEMDPWGSDPWDMAPVRATLRIQSGSGTCAETVSPGSKAPATAPALIIPTTAAPLQPSVPTPASSSRLGAKVVPASTFNASSFIQAPLNPATISPTPPMAAPVRPAFPPISPTSSGPPPAFSSFGAPPPRHTTLSTPLTPSGPNYNISMSPSASSQRPTQLPQEASKMSLTPSAPALRPTPAAPPGYSSGLLQPTTIAIRPPPATSNAGLEFDPFA